MKRMDSLNQLVDSIDNDNQEITNNNNNSIKEKYYELKKQYIRLQEEHEILILRCEESDHRMERYHKQNSDMQIEIDSLHMELRTNRIVRTKEEYDHLQ